MVILNMVWTYELTQQRDRDNNLIPLWTVTQWNTNTSDIKFETTITTAVKEVAYPDD